MAGLLAGLLLIATEFSTVASVKIKNVTESCESKLASQKDADRCSLSGFERHGGAFLLLGLLTGAMAWGAAMGRSRPAALALVVIGALVIALSLTLDLPKTHETGAVGFKFEGAEGRAGPGLYFELIGGALAVAAGLLRLARPDD